jgi:hypothetical protein
MLLISAGINQHFRTALSFLGRRDSDGFGSAVVSTAVFGVSPKTSPCIRIFTDR